MKTGAESDEVADMLVQSLLSDGELMFGGVGKDDGAKNVKAQLEIFEKEEHAPHRCCPTTMRS